MSEKSQEPDDTSKVEVPSKDGGKADADAGQKHQNTSGSEEGPLRGPSDPGTMQRDPEDDWKRESAGAMGLSPAYPEMRGGIILEFRADELRSQAERRRDWHKKTADELKARKDKADATLKRISDEAGTQPLNDKAGVERNNASHESMQCNAMSQNCEGRATLFNVIAMHLPDGVYRLGLGELRELEFDTPGSDIQMT